MAFCRVELFESMNLADLLRKSADLRVGGQPVKIADDVVSEAHACGNHPDRADFGGYNGTIRDLGEGSMLLMIDNHDSFTYNIVQYLRELGVDVQVECSDAITVEEVRQRRPSHIVISPGPGTPEAAGICIPLIRALAAEVPILGVCLGHQCLAVAFGGKVVRAGTVMHGKTSHIFHNSTGVFAGLPTPFKATRYHSLIVDPVGLPDVLEVTAWARRAEGDEIMGLRHRSLPVEGVQFHPESILSEHGHTLFETFLKK